MITIWRNRIVDIYIIKEVLLPFIAGVAIVTVIGLSSFLFQLADFIIEKHIALSVVMKLLLYQLPDIIVQTFPVAVLFATIYGMARLSRENEFTALRLGGISLYRLISPLLIMGIVISALTYFINEEVVPWSNHEAKNIIRINILKQVAPDVENNVFFKGPEGRLFFVNKYDENKNTLENIVVYQMPDGDDEFPEIVTARSGKILGMDNEDGDKKWLLRDGIIHRYSNDGKLYQGYMFDSMEYEIVDQIENFIGEQRTTSEMSREELGKNIALFQRSGINVDDLLVEYHMKLSMPLITLIFILIGTPLSLGRKNGLAFSIIFTIIIVFSYYLVSSLARSFGGVGTIPPLLAAWLPNIIFGILGLMLLIWHEKWQNLMAKISILGVVVLIFLMTIPAGTVSAESLSVSKADSLSYNQETGKYELKGDIMGQYRQYHIFADKVSIVSEDGKVEPVDKIDMIKSKFTGCDLEKPHYYFDATEVIIYPDDHLLAKNVIFRELNGYLPLFYWPILYISLKDRDQHLVPRVGYSSSRGWFLKTTYYYWYQNRLPGELYLDYYTKSGYAGGVKQYFMDDSDLKAYVYLYGQENRTNLSNLFNWEGEISIDNNRSAWKTDTYIKYIDYDNYSKLDGRIDLSNNADDWSLNVDSKFKSTDYYESDENDVKDYGFDMTYQKDLGNKWNYFLNLYRYYKYNKEDGLSQRWGGKTYVQRDIGNLDYKLTYQRDAPDFTEEDDEKDKVTYLRWPEFELNYKPRGPLDYNFQLGNYYEDSSELQGLRSSGKVTYDKNWRLTKKIRFSTEHHLTGRVYKLDNYRAGNYIWLAETIYGYPYLLSYNNSNTLNFSLYPGLTWSNTYSYSEYRGQSPFTFDSGQKKENINTKLSYKKAGLSVVLSTAYNIYKSQYSPITLTTNWKVKKGWDLNFGTKYYIKDKTFGDLVITNKYKDDKWQYNSGLSYDLNNSQLKQIDNELIYDLDDEWHFELHNSYDNLDQKFDSANLALRKVFHCRTITFSYDYLKQEYTLEYNINLFPDQKIMVGRNEEDSFMFDVGIDDLIDKE